MNLNYFHNRNRFVFIKIHCRLAACAPRLLAFFRLLDYSIYYLPFTLQVFIVILEIYVNI